MAYVVIFPKECDRNRYPSAEANIAIQTDWDRVAVAEGLKSATVAHLRFGQIKKRLEWVPNTSVSAAGSPSRIDKHKGTAKANTTRPRGKKALEALEEAVNNMGKSEEDVEDAEGDRETEATAEGPLTADKEGDDTLES